MQISSHITTPIWVQGLQQDPPQTASLFSGAAQDVQASSAAGQTSPTGSTTPTAISGGAGGAGSSLALSTLQSPADQFAPSTLNALISTQVQSTQGQSASGQALDQALQDLQTGGAQHHRHHSHGVKAPPQGAETASTTDAAPSTTTAPASAG